jgi:transcriptional regulator with XRE-family HTH domain
VSASVTSAPAAEACTIEVTAPEAPKADAAGYGFIPHGPDLAAQAGHDPVADNESKGPISAIDGAAVSGAGFILAPRVSSAVAVAMDFAKAGGGWAGPLVFNVWLRRQLRERRISQRQLGILSGVSHSTISRLLTGHRSPSLQTATRLVHALRMEWSDDQVATYFDLLPEQTLMPTQRVESALRGDGALDDDDIRAVMNRYLLLRARRRRLHAGTPSGEPIDISIRPAGDDPIMEGA